MDNKLLSWNWRLLKKIKLHDTFLKRRLWKKTNDECQNLSQNVENVDKGEEHWKGESMN